MEKTKKSLGIVAIVMTFVLLAGVVGYVVYAAITQSFNFGGTVKFEAEGVEATVDNAQWEDCTVNGVTASDDDTLHEFTYSTTKSKDSSGDYLSTWQDLTVVITDTTDGTATISFDVTNNFTDDTVISVTIGDTVFGTGTEATTTNEDITIVADPNYATIEAGETESFTITFTVDPSYNLAETTFTIPVSIEVVEETVIQDGVEYTLSASGTAAVTGYSGSATSVEIASEVSGTDASAAALSLDTIVSAQSSTTYTVKIIAPNAFSGATSITTLTLPSSIEMIGANAFKGCENLTKLVNQSQVTIEAGSYGTPSDVTVKKSLLGAYSVTLSGVSGYGLAYAVDGETSYTDFSGSTTVYCDEKILIMLYCGSTVGAADITDSPDWTIESNSITLYANGQGIATSHSYTDFYSLSVSINNIEVDTVSYLYRHASVDSSDYSFAYYTILVDVTEDTTVSWEYIPVEDDSDDDDSSSG